MRAWPDPACWVACSQNWVFGGLLRFRQVDKLCLSHCTRLGPSVLPASQISRVLRDCSSASRLSPLLVGPLMDPGRALSLWGRGARSTPDAPAWLCRENSCAFPALRPGRGLRLPWFVGSRSASLGWPEKVGSVGSAADGGLPVPRSWNVGVSAGAHAALLDIRRNPIWRNSETRDRAVSFLYAVNCQASPDHTSPRSAFGREKSLVSGVPCRGLWSPGAHSRLSPWPGQPGQVHVQPLHAVRSADGPGGGSAPSPSEGSVRWGWGWGHGRC